MQQRLSPQRLDRIMRDLIKTSTYNNIALTFHKIPSPIEIPRRTFLKQAHAIRSIATLIELEVLVAFHELDMFRFVICSMTHEWCGKWTMERIGCARFTEDLWSRVVILMQGYSCNDSTGVWWDLALCGLGFTFALKKDETKNAFIWN